MLYFPTKNYSKLLKQISDNIIVFIGDNYATYGTGDTI